MNNTVLILGLVGIAATLVFAAHYANKGNSITIGTPFFKAQIN
ncbi:MAG TPA: hypothetical protein VIN73_10245 [Vicingaceae bacterium]